MTVRFPVRSVLAEPVVSLSRLMELKTGDVIPISFGPKVPVMVGGDLLGMGTVGTANAAPPSSLPRSTDRRRTGPCSRRIRRMNDMAGGFPDTSVAANFRLLQDVDVKLTVEIGSTQLSLRELLALSESSVIELDRQANELLDVLVNGTLIGRGEVVTVGDRFGVRLTELVNPDKRG